MNLVVVFLKSPPPREIPRRYLKSNKVSFLLRHPTIRCYKAHSRQLLNTSLNKRQTDTDAQSSKSGVLKYFACLPLSATKQSLCIIGVSINEPELERLVDSGEEVYSVASNAAFC